ncbi:MAG: ABC transporter substrate-binding protein [Patescibacteria group bacterium]
MDKSTKIIIWIVVIALAIWGILSFSKKAPVSTSGGSIKIGQMSGLTGIGSDIGVEERNGALLAVEEINARGGIAGRAIDLVSEDSPALDLKQGVSVATKLMTINNVLAIVGPQWDGQAEVVASVSGQEKVPVISPNASTDIETKINSPYFFTTWPKNEVGIRELLKFAKERGWKKIAIIEPANFSFWAYTASLFEKNAPEFGIEIVSKEMGTDYTVVDYRTLIAKAKSKNPDAIFGSYAELECVFLRQSRELGLAIPLLSTESAGTPKALVDCPTLLEDRLYFATPAQGNGYDKFAEAYESRFEKKPLSPSAVTAHNAILVLSDVIGNLVKSDKEISRENIRIGLDSVKFENGVSMPVIEFDEKGFVITSPEAFEMQTVRDGQFVKLEN